MSALKNKKMSLKKTQKTIKDLILFDSAWKNRNKVKDLSKKAIQKIEIYRNLVKNSFSDISANIYPVTYKLLSKNWNSLLSDYIEKYPPSSPILNKAVEHFSEYLSFRKDILKKYPFIVELVFYEWLEVEIYEKEGGKEKNKILSLNPIHEICTFQYPIPSIVELIENKRLLKKVCKQKTNVIIYRDPKDFSVRFFELSSSSLTFIELLKSGFPLEMAIYLLSNAFQIDERNYKNFEKEAMKLVRTLKKSRILI